MVDFGAIRLRSTRPGCTWARFVVVPGCRVGMERPCRGTPVGRSGLRDDDHATGQRRLDRTGLGGDGNRRAAVRHLDAGDSRAGRAGRDPGPGGRRRLRAGFASRWRRRSSRPTAPKPPRQCRPTSSASTPRLIAQLEAQYGQMWAQDAAAMYSYAGQSASATQVTPFATPAATTNPAGTATQASAVSQATGTSAASSSQSILSQLTSSMPSPLQSLASPAATSAATTTDAVSIALLLHLRNDRPAHEPFGVGRQLLAVRQLVLQH